VRLKLDIKHLSLASLDHHYFLNCLPDVEAAHFLSELASIDLGEGKHIVNVIVQQFG